MRVLGANLSVFLLYCSRGIEFDMKYFNELVSACARLNSVPLNLSDASTLDCTRKILSIPMHNVKRLRLRSSYKAMPDASETVKHTRSEILNLVASNFQGSSLTVGHGILNRVADKKNVRLKRLHFVARRYRSVTCDCRCAAFFHVVHEYVQFYYQL